MVSQAIEKGVSGRAERMSRLINAYRMPAGWACPCEDQRISASHGTNATLFAARHKGLGEINFLLVMATVELIVRQEARSG
jgi:hypothetical protein